MFVSHGRAMSTLAAAPVGRPAPWGGGHAPQRAPAWECPGPPPAPVPPPARAGMGTTSIPDDSLWQQSRAYHGKSVYLEWCSSGLSKRKSGLSRWKRRDAFCRVPQSSRLHCPVFSLSLTDVVTTTAYHPSPPPTGTRRAGAVMAKIWRRAATPPH